MAGKADIVDAIADGVEGITKKQAAEAIAAIRESSATPPKQGERVKIPGLGSLSVSKRAARMGRNPKTGESIKIKASKVAKFKMGKELKERLN